MVAPERGAVASCVREAKTENQHMAMVAAAVDDALREMDACLVRAHGGAE
jgi:hypothetical protein